MLALAALFMVTATLVFHLREGASWGDAIIQGLVFGPGWLALQFLLLVIGRAFGWFKEDED